MTRPPAAAVRRATVAAGTVVIALLVFVPAQLGSRAVTGHPPDRGVWVVAAAAVALLVPLLRPVVDRVADWLAYGRGGDPYAVVAGFVARVSETLAVDDVLPHLARTAAQVVHGPAGDVRVWLADGREWHESWRVPGQRDRGPAETDGEGESSPLVTVPLAYDGSTVGELGVALPGGEVSPAARELLRGLAGPAGVAVSNVRLTVELRRRLAEEEELAEALRRSRERLVQARLVQRRRLAADVERRVHAPLGVLDEVLTAGASSEPNEIDWERAREVALAALESLREVAHGVYPPVLAMSGLAAALELRLAESGVPLEVVGECRASEDVEAVAYFCCLLLLEDPAKDARVRLTLAEDAIRLVVERSELDEGTLETVHDRVDPAGGTATVTRLPEGRVEVAVQLPARQLCAPSST